MIKRFSKPREAIANPFKRKRRPNGEARYLNKREKEMPRGTFNRDGNRAALSTRTKN